MDPRVAAALGIASARAAPRDGQLDALFEARCADTGEDWSQHVRKNSGFDFVFAPHKSVSLAAEFAPTEAERQMIRNAFHAASDDALRYAAHDLGYARKGTEFARREEGHYAFFGAPIDTALILDHWNDLLHLATSISTRFVVPSTILKKLSASPRPGSQEMSAPEPSLTQGGLPPPHTSSQTQRTNC